jgi:phosphoenolpyruvate synthase/pyruvate phosphate dikinase
MQEIARGMPASAGTYEGDARVILSSDELPALQEGEVLIVRASNPAWTVGMLRSGAIVTELGGPICHAAIVAREIGVPAVVAVPDAMTVIATGSRVRVDGSTGVIYA